MAGMFDDLVPDGSKPKAEKGGGGSGPWEDFNGPWTAYQGGAFDDLIPKPQEKSGLMRRAVGDTAVSAVKGAVGLVEAGIGLADIPTFGKAGQAAEAIGIRTKDAKAALDDLYSPEQKAANKAVSEAEGFIGTAKTALQNPSTIGHAVIESAPLLLPGAAIARGIGAAGILAPAVAGGIGEGVVGAGMAAEQMRQNSEDGTLSGRQMGAALASGAGTAAFGIAGGKLAQSAIGKKLGMADVDTALAMNPAQRAAAGGVDSGLVKRIAGGAVSEGVLEELPQSMWEQAAQNYGEGKPLGEGVAEAGAMGMLAGGVMGGGFNALQGQRQKKDDKPATGTEESPTLALPAPTYTGTPADQTLAADVERANQVAAAQANADQVYAERAAFEQQHAPEKLPVTGPLSAAVNVGIDAGATSITSPANPRFDVPAEPRGSFAQQAELARLIEEERADADDRRELAQLVSQERRDQSRRIAEASEQRQALEDALADADQRVAGAAAQESEAARLRLLDSVLVDAGESGNPARQFGNALRRAGYRNTDFTEREQQTIQRFTDARAALNSPEATTVPAAPNELDSEAVGIRERTGGQQNTGAVPRDNAAEVVDLLSQGWKPVGKTLISPKGKRRNLNAEEFAAVREARARINGKATGAFDPQQVVQETAAQNGAKVAAPGGNVAASETPGEWSAFSEGSGSLGVPRAEMPQIKAEHRGAMTQFMKARGVMHQRETVAADSLRPTQAEFSPAKVKKALGFEGGDRSILVSSDGYVLDGHHQWLAKRENGGAVDVIRFDAPITDLVELANEYPSSTNAAGDANENPINSALAPDPGQVTDGADGKAEFKKAQIDLGNALRDFAPAARMVPEKTPELMPTLTRLFKASVGEVGTNPKDLIAHVKKRLKAEQETKAIWNKVGNDIYQKAALQAVGDVAAQDAVKKEQQSHVAPIMERNERDAVENAAAAKAEKEKQDRQFAQPTEKIEDFGEKIGGARKDVWSGFKDDLNAVSDEDIAGQPLSKIWPAPDYDKMIEGGTSAEVVATIRAIRDEIPAKPRQSWKVKRWAEQVKVLREFANGIIDGKTTLTEMKNLAGANRALEHVFGRTELYMAVGHSKSLQGVRLSFHRYTIYKGQENVSMWSVEQGAKATAWSNWPRELATGKTKEEAIAAFKARYETLDINTAASRQATFDIYSKSGENGYWIGKKVGRNPILLDGPFGNIKEARAYKDANNDKLVAKLEKAKDVPSERRETNEPRVGVDMRNGQDVTPQLFAETFGFKGVEFGNWVEGKKRQQDLNEAFDALMDMAAILNLPPKALSLNGELGLAFGARGKGGINPAKAHYEPDYIAINMTKKDGAGSLGHEWWHALDNYFSRMRGKGGDMMTEALDVSLVSRGSEFVENTKVRKEMIVAFGNVVRAIKQTALKARSAKLDAKRSKKYWTTQPEMSARAFESFLISKLQDQNASNDYLANIVDEKTWQAAESLGFELDASYPYPTAGEIPQIRAAFDEFFNAIQTRETERGVEMFNVASSPSISQADKAVYGMVAEGKSAADIMKFIASASRSPFNRQLAKLLMKTGITPKVTASDAKGWKFNAGQGNKYAAAYNPTTDTVALFRPSAAERNMLHELVHAATIKALSGKGMASAQMNALYNHVKKTGKLKGMYGMSNEEEFVAEAFTNPSFQQRLKSISAPTSNNKLGTAWDWFIRVVRGILGLPTNQDNALSRALEIGLGVMRDDMKLRDAGRGVAMESRVAAPDATNVNAQIGEEIVASMEEISRALTGKPLAVLNTSEAPHLGKARLREWAIGIFRDYGFYANNPTIGKVLMDERSVRDSIGHSLNPFKAVAFKAVPDVIENGVIAYVERRGKVDSIYISGSVVINGSDDIVTVLVHRDVNTQRMYLHSVTTKESLLRSSQSSADTEVSGRSGTVISGGISKILQDALNYNGNEGAKESRAEQKPLNAHHKFVKNIVEKAADKFKAEYSGAAALDIRVVYSRDEIPARYRPSPYAEGVYHDREGIIYLVASNMPTKQRAWQVLMHEAVGHYGLANMMGEEFSDLWPTVLQRASLGRPLNYDPMPGEKHYETVEAVRRLYPEASDSEIAQEVLARMAETMPKINWFRFAMLRIQRWISGAAERFGVKLSMSMDDVRGLVQLAGEHLRRGANLDREQAGDQVAFASQRASAESRATPFMNVLDAGDSAIAALDGWLDRNTRMPDEWTAQQKDAAGKFATFSPRQPVKSMVRGINNRMKDRAAQLIFDQFRPLKKLSEEAFMQAHLSKATDGALEAVATLGIPVLRDGALAVDKQDDGGFIGALVKKLGNAQEVNQFLMWVAANRAEKLTAEGRENLFTPEDIAAMKGFSKGKMDDGRPRPVAYAEAHSRLKAYNKAVLDIAEQAGLIDGEARKNWESDFYIPFYRVSEETGEMDFSAGGTGLVRQKVIKQLKGGTDNLGDPLANIMANWHMMLTASMRNMAANKALEQGQSMGIADRVEMPSQAVPAAKGGTWTMQNGQKVLWQVHDPMVAESLEALNFTGYNNPAMRAAGKFKHMLTMGVTISPTFRIRNLMRDALQAVATADVGYNPLKNAVDGWKLTAKDSGTMAQLIAGGGAVRFGSFNDGQQAEYAKRMIAMGIKDNQILNTTDKLKNFFRRFYDSYQESGDRAETINRAVIYERVLNETGSHLQASFAARDLMNFTSMGSSAAIRALAQVLPFFNARLQGMDRLVRGAAADPRRFWSVAGVIGMASALLYLLQGDDDEYKALPDYVRDAYWPVKLGGMWAYIPKPFEVGALGTVVERFTELMMAGDDYQARDFRDTMVGVLANTLAMNPVPQIVKPIGEAWFNYDMFRGQAIDSMAMERLLPQERFNANTSAAAVGVGRALEVSPQKVEHLVRGYFGWLGTQALNVGDLMARPFMDMPASPKRDMSSVNNWLVAGDLFKDAGTAPSKYVERYYRVQREINAIYATASQARNLGNMDQYNELMNRPEMAARPLIKNADRQITQINQRMRAVMASQDLSVEQKNEMLTELRLRREGVARQVDEAARARAQ